MCPQKIYSIFGNRWEKDIIYRKKWRILQRQIILGYIPVLSRGSGGWTEEGILSSSFMKKFFSDKRPGKFYICVDGEDMLHEARQRLEAIGDRKKTEFESYD
ncbi:MAG: hypothetical protein IPH33_12510 [Bacteroidetes bacterium]|nr:hypothetical protein [Bacteroidota bacterium]